jgi:hypothetical protein
VNGACVPGTPIQCPADAYSCTTEQCDETTKSSITLYTDTTCQDGLYCNGIETCDPAKAPAGSTTGCAPGTAVNCSDGVSCTVDSCNESTHSCVHLPSDAACNDGLFCDGVETCAPGAPGADGTTGCKPGTTVNCDDSIPCTTDSCNETTDQCDHAADNSKCSNGVYCDGAEVCNPAAGCQAGIPVNCPDTDGIACTVEACDEPTHTCTSTIDNTKCSGGQVCVPPQGCITQSCTTNAQCDDGNACNGIETCDTTVPGGQCKPGTPVNCNDNIACTFDECNQTTGACSHTAFDSFCSDGDVCNGIETCSLTQGCVGGTPLVCNDNKTCTIDTCNSSSGCVYQPNDAACQDSSICNGAESCNPSAPNANGTTGCVPSPGPLVCPPDGIACTTETCVEGVGCKSVPDNSVCACGETCVPSLGGCGNWCKPGAATCQGKTYQCGDCVDNDGDCKIDAADPYCIGVCSNNESGFKGNIPGQNNAPCKADCYFDQDTGSGNDDCHWSHECDPYEVAPNYPPEGSKCKYNPNANIPGTSQTCAQLYSAQSALCLSYCGPLVPNGCDCFGCCSIPGAPTTVYLGSEDGSGNGTCHLGTLADPLKCKPCTQVPSCINTCTTCEICIGKPTLPPECTEQDCPAGKQKCGLVGQAPCPDGQYCVTGCCQPVPT